MAKTEKDIREPWVCKKCDAGTCSITLNPIGRGNCCILSKKFILIDITDGAVVGEYKEPPLSRDREQTKIVSVKCQDCGEVMTMLVGASANIIGARCPACTEKFKKDGEEHNKSIGYKARPSNNEMVSQASDAVTGIERLFYGLEPADTIIRYLNSGLKFIDNLEATEETERIKKSLMSTINLLQQYSKETNPKQLYGEDETKRMCRFFSHQAKPYMVRTNPHTMKSQGR